MLLVLGCRSPETTILLLDTLEGIDLHDMIKPDDYFSWNEDEDEDDNNDEPTFPMEGSVLERLGRYSSITCISISCTRDNADPKQIQALAVAAPQLKRLDIFTVSAQVYLYRILTSYLLTLFFFAVTETMVRLIQNFPQS